MAEQMWDDNRHEEGRYADFDSENPQWYVVHTYSGYENKVKANIEKIVENRGMQDLICEVSVPTQNTVEMRNGKKKLVSRKIFPGYVLVKMFMNDDTWYVVRNTRGVTAFVGPGSRPVPLSEEEMLVMGLGEGGVVLNIAVGDSVKIISGPFQDSIGSVCDLNHQKKTVTVKLSIFGRETPVELDFIQVERV